MARRQCNVSLLATACVYCVFTMVSMSAGEIDSTAATEAQTGSTGFTDALNNFGYKLSMQILKETNNTNVVLSPIGVTAKLSKAVYAVRRIKQFTDVETAKLIYFSYFHSIMSYAILLWSKAADFETIFILQKRSIRAIYKFKSRLSLREKFEEIGLLAMALLGSVGRSYDELSDKLGFSQDVLTNRKHHEQLGQLLEKLNNNETHSKTMYADAIFVDMQYKLREVYRSYLTEVYHGEAKSVDFKNNEAAKILINDWVSNNTNGKLSMFLKDTPPLGTKVALFSALYFSGQWERPFLVEHTRNLPFTTASGDEVLVDQMLNLGRFKYAFSKDDGFEILAFPYNDSVTTLYAVKPRFPKKTSLLEIMDSIDYVKINNLIHQMEDTECIIRFPKMDLNSDLKLENALKALGIRAIFSPEANFALMIAGHSNTNRTEEDLIQRINDGDGDKTQLQTIISNLPNPEVYVDTVLHSVKITIDEYGTEASAATGALLSRSVQQFYLNSPFYMFIRNEKTQLVTFSAVINTPTS